MLHAVRRSAFVNTCAATGAATRRRSGPAGRAGRSRGTQPAFVEHPLGLTHRGSMLPSRAPPRRAQPEFGEQAGAEQVAHRSARRVAAGSHSTRTVSSSNRAGRRNTHQEVRGEACVPDADADLAGTPVRPGPALNLCVLRRPAGWTNSPCASSADPDGDAPSGPDWRPAQRRPALRTRLRADVECARDGQHRTLGG